MIQSFSQWSMEDLASELDGSDCEQFVKELKAKGGAGEIAAEILWRAYCAEQAKADPSSCVADLTPTP